MYRFVTAVALVIGLAAATPGVAAARGDAPRYRPPVAAPVADPFRPPSRFAGPGNRGLEYATRPGQRVVASGGGTVAFAGSVADRLIVAIDHPDGLRTTYSGLRRIDAVKGRSVAAGQPIGTATARFHFGVRAGRAYLDPSLLFAASGGPPRLIPVVGLGGP